MKICLILVTKNQIKYLEDCLKTWIAAKDYYSLLIVVIDKTSNDGSKQFLKEYKHRQKIDYLNFVDEKISGFECQNIGCEWALTQNTDIIIKINAEDMFLLSDIHNIIQYIKDSSSIIFDIEYKNFIDLWRYTLGNIKTIAWKTDTNNCKNPNHEIIPNICVKTSVKNNENRVIYEEMHIYSTPYGRFVLEPMDGVCKTISEGKFWDEWMKPHLDGLSIESIAVDVGASIGFHTVYMAKRCKHVYSFEPQIINYDRLVKNVELNNLSNVTCYNVALYSKERKMAVNNILNQKTIQYDGGAVQACSLTLYENDSGDIDAKTLDSFSLPKTDFWKIDAEGSEYDIFMGGLETIKRDRPIIIFEYSKISGVHDHNWGEYLGFFKNLNYDIKEVAGQNYLAVPR